MAEVMTRSEILKELPLQEKFVIVDRAVRESDTRIVGMKAVSNGEWYFMGHFPGHPIMPGVLQIEAFCQLAELLCWKELDPERKGDIFLKNLNRVKFRQPSIPGDRIRFTVELSGKSPDGFDFTCRAENNQGVASEAQIRLGLRPKMQPEMPPMFNEFDKSSAAMDVTAISKYLPHRYPFLLVDYVQKIDPPKILAVKNACSDEAAFRCYADGYRVLSGAVFPEIIAQAACVGVMMQEANRGKIAYFLGIDKTEFFRPVLPGDQIICDIQFPETKKRVGKGTGEMKVGDEVLMRTEVTYIIVDP